MSRGNCNSSQPHSNAPCRTAASMLLEVAKLKMTMLHPTATTCRIRSHVQAMSSADDTLPGGRNLRIPSVWATRHTQDKHGAPLLRRLQIRLLSWHDHSEESLSPHILPDQKEPANSQLEAPSGESKEKTSRTPAGILCTAAPGSGAVHLSI